MSQLGKSATETVKMMKEAYQDKCVSDGTIYRLHKEFLDSRKSVSFTSHGGQPSASML